MANIQNIKKFILLIIFCCLASLSIAYVTEYFFDILPCKLCSYQRYILFFILLISILSFFIKQEMCRLRTLIIIALSFFVNFFVAVYQVLIEQGIVALPAICEKPLLFNNSFEEFHAAMMTMTKHPSCDQVQWNLLGISFAGYSAIFYICIFILCSMVIIKKYKNVKK